MTFGYNAKEAVEFAHRFDAHTGADVDVIDIGKKKRAR